MSDKPTARKRGPDPERVKIEGMDWGEAVQKALQKPAPPKAKARKRKRK